MGQRLLIVDGDRRFLQEHQTALESTFEVDVLHSSEAALAQLETGQYAAVLLCVEVSENKGYSLCTAIRRSPALEGLKVALISSKATEEEYARHQGLKFRADLYLFKPIETAALVTALSPIVPLKVVDPDNPLGDFGGTDLGDEWLDSLRCELEQEDALAAEAAALLDPLDPPLDLAELDDLEPAAPEPLALPAPAPTPADEPVPWAAPIPAAEAIPGTEAAPEASQALTAPRRPAPAAPGAFILPPLPLAPQTAQRLAVPRDSGRVELLEARVKDLESKLVAKADELDQQFQELNDLRVSHNAVTRNLDEMEERQLQAELLQAKLRETQEILVAQAAQSQAVAAALQAELETSRGQAQALREAQDQLQAQNEALSGQLSEAAAQLSEASRQNLDVLESNQLIQAQMEELREQAASETRDHEALKTALEISLRRAQEEHSELERRLGEQAAETRLWQERHAEKDAALQELAQAHDDSEAARKELEASRVRMESQMAAMAASHDQQRMELLTGIDEREAELGRLRTERDGLQARLQDLEGEKAGLEKTLEAQSERSAALLALLSDLEDRASQALGMAKAAL